MFTPVPAKVIDLTSNGRPSKYRVYKLQQVETPIEDAPQSDVPVIDPAEDTGDVVGDEVLEIEEDEDDTLSPALEDRGDA